MEYQDPAYLPSALEQATSNVDVYFYLRTFSELKRSEVTFRLRLISNAMDINEQKKRREKWIDEINQCVKGREVPVLSLSSIIPHAFQRIHQLQLDQHNHLILIGSNTRSGVRHVCIEVWQINDTKLFEKNTPNYSRLGYTYPTHSPLHPVAQLSFQPICKYHRSQGDAVGISVESERVVQADHHIVQFTTFVSSTAEIRSCKAANFITTRSWRSARSRRARRQRAQSSNHRVAV